MVLLSSLNLHHQSFSPLLLLLQSASLDLVCHYSENSVVRLIFLFAFLLAFLKKGKTNAPAVYYFFWVMYIFLNSIGNTKTTTPSGGRWCKFLGTFTRRTRGRSRVTWTLQLPVESDDASSEAFSSASQESVPEVETSLEWQPTPQVQHRLHLLNNFLRNSADGRVSPIRSQLCTDVLNLSSSSSRYYKRKAVQAVETVLEAIAPQQSTCLFNRVAERYSSGRDGNRSDNQLVGRLIKLYEEANSGYTRQKILSIFVCDHSKSELLTLIPGLTK